MPSRLEEIYYQKVCPQLKEQLGYTNPMQLPKLTKITINVGIGHTASDKNVAEKAREDLARISGQRPVLARARKSVAGFKLREGMVVGCFVTLRGRRMYEFFDRLVSTALPRVRDFRGLSARSFDGRGNYTFGLKEQIVFPEVAYDQVDAIRGMDITIATTAKTDEEARALLTAFGFPFRK